MRMMNQNADIVFKQLGHDMAWKEIEIFHVKEREKMPAIDREKEMCLKLRCTNMLMMIYDARLKITTQWYGNKSIES